eukprot:SAG11_NODE_4597_length_1840_cov_1.155658_1_plen_456_part_10
MANAPPQLRALCTALEKITADDLELFFTTCARRIKGQVPTTFVEAEIKSKLSAYNITGGGQSDLLKSCSFLVQQASRGVDPTKLAGRLKPLGFTDEALLALQNATRVQAPPAKAPAPAARAPAVLDDGSEEEEIHTQAEIDAMAAQLMDDESDEEPEPAPEADEQENDEIDDEDSGSEFSSDDDYSDYSDDEPEMDLIARFRAGQAEHDDDDDTDEEDYSDEDEVAEAEGGEAAGEPAPESESEAGEPAPAPVRKDVLAKLPLYDALFLVRALETHMTGGNLGKDEIMQISTVAKRNKIPFPRLAYTLRVLKTVVAQAVEGEIRIEEHGEGTSGIDTRKAAELTFTDENQEEQLGLKLTACFPTMEGDAVTFLVSVATRLFRGDHQSIVRSASGEADSAEAGGEEEDGDVSGIRDWLLIETGKGTWQKRYFVLSAGKLEVFYSPEAMSDEDRIYLL